MSDLFVNGIVGFLCFLSAASIIFSMLMDKEGKKPLFIVFVLIVCTGNFIAGLHRIMQALSLSDSEWIAVFLNKAYPVNDILLIISGFLLSLMIYKHHIGDKALHGPENKTHAYNKIKENE